MTIVEVMRKFPTESDCVRHIENVRWGKGKSPICPKCGHTGTGTKRPDGRYNCCKCRLTYRATHGTIFHGTQIPLQKWFLLVAIMLNARMGVSSHQLARDCGLNQKTAWRMAMQVRKAMADEQGALLKGIVEIDETHIGGRPRSNMDRLGATQKYLDRYIAEFAYRFNRRRLSYTFYETIENAIFAV